MLLLLSLVKLFIYDQYSHFVSHYRQQQHRYHLRYVCNYIVHSPRDLPTPTNSKHYWNYWNNIFLIDEPVREQKLFEMYDHKKHMMTLRIVNISVHLEWKNEMEDPT